jgi:transcription initiation factor TFIIIB Brf1 subunit/transcription initiation factor TFIIB
MYRAGDVVDQQEWLAELDAVASRLELESTARSTARDIFLSSVPASERSKRPVLAASIYAAALIEGDQREQTAVAEAAGVSRLSIQKRWKDLLEANGFRAPSW